jgi:hypothetical protein
MQIIRRSDLVTLRKYVIGDKCTKICHQLFVDERLEIKKIHEELITALGDDAYHLLQIKTWLQRFKNDDLSCKDHSRPGRPVLTLVSQLEAFLFS